MPDQLLRRLCACETIPILINGVESKPLTVTAESEKPTVVSSLKPSSDRTVIGCRLWGKLSLRKTELIANL
jgi:hypothetical protein